MSEAGGLRAEPLLNAERAAKRLNVPPSWLLAQARAGTIPHIRLGRYVRFEAELLERWLETKRSGPKEDT